jgi:protoheme IX farnesyltransferase
MPRTKNHVIGYMLAFVAATLMLTFGGYTGYGYLAVAAAVGFCWLYMAWSGYKTSDDRVWAKIFGFRLNSLVVQRFHT